METVLRDPQGCLLLDDVFLRDVDLLLERAYADVAGGNVADQRHKNVVIGRDRCEIRGIGGFDAPAEPAPEIELPVDLGAKRSPPVIAKLMDGVGGRIDGTGLIIADVA